MYARSFAGRVSRLQALFAKTARGDDRYEALDEREIAADLELWLEERAKLTHSQAIDMAARLRKIWMEGLLGVPTEAEELEVPEEPDERPAKRQARVPDRSQGSYVIVEVPGAIFRLHKAGATGCWMGKRRAFRNARILDSVPGPHEYTHACKLCWPNQGAISEGDASEGSLANSEDDEAR